MIKKKWLSCYQDGEVQVASAMFMAKEPHPTYWILIDDCSAESKEVQHIEYHNDETLADTREGSLDLLANEHRMIIMELREQLSKQEAILQLIEETI